MPISQAAQYLLSSFELEEVNTMLTQQFLEENSSQEILEKVLRIAVKNNLLSVVNCLFNFAEEPADIVFFSYDNGEIENESLIIAAENNNLEMLEFLFANLPTEKHSKIIAANDYQIFRVSAYLGHVNVINFLFEKLPQEKHSEMIFSYSEDYEEAPYEGIRDAIKFGFPEVFNSILARADKKQHKEINKICEHYVANEESVTVSNNPILSQLNQKIPSTSIKTNNSKATNKRLIDDSSNIAARKVSPKLDL